MRPILFRGKRKATGEWVQGDLYTHPEVGHTIIDHREPIHQNDGVYLGTKVIAETVGQYIGVYDKNAVKQFEHDILKVTWTTESTRGYFQLSDAWCEHEVICVIQYVKDRFACIGKDGKQVSFKSDAKREVIGNLHDNPELME